MKANTILTLVIFVIALSSCAPKEEKKEQKVKKKDDVQVSYIKQNDETYNTLKKKAAAVIKISEVELGKALQNALKEGGPEYAVDFCNIEAMEITDSISKAEGLVVRRLAKKNRNPKNETNAIESKIFKQYVMDYLTGVTLKSKVAIDEEGHPVYYKPIVTKSNCLMCHGTPGETMTTELAEKISSLYPEDKAINFAKGHPRGMWAVTFTKLTVSPQK